MKHPEVHGTLLRCADNRSHSGMMVNSNAYHSISIQRDGEQQIIETRDKEEFRDPQAAKYLAADDVLAEIKAFIDRENFAAMSELKEQPSPFGHPTDMSSSSSISLRFDDSSLGGSRFVLKTIFPAALRWNGVGDLAEEFHTLLTAAVENATLIPFPEGSWICKVCGTPGNTEDTCSNCRLPKQ